MRTTMRLTLFTLIALVTANEASAETLINLLVYETDRTLVSGNNLINSNIPGLAVQTVGLGKSFEGFGSKYTAVLPALQQLDPAALTIISDGRDVLLNHKANGGAESSRAALESFVQNFHALVGQREGAVVVSAEAQCCVSALTYAAPGDYYSVDGSRTNRACFSGKSDCMWNGDDKAQPWEDFMKSLAQQNEAAHREDIYLNAGLMVGRASDLINLIIKADIGSEEDDQAVLTGLLFLHPDLILLDYSQVLFGNNRADSCMFEMHGQQLVHKQTQTTPLLVHTPGGRATCHADLMAELGQNAMTQTVRRRLLEWKTVNNYSCPKGYKLDKSGYCVVESCYDNFQCPVGSTRIPNRMCYNSCDDCQCKQGFVMKSGKCVFTLWW